MINVLKNLLQIHADMMLGKDADLEAFKYLDKKKVVCATRIEPPLHPENGEKIIKDFGMWPEKDVEEGWLEDDFDKYVEEAKVEFKDKTTNGCFAPWMMYKDEFLSIGGHDPIFASAREDSDVFNRLVLGGFELIQSWQSFVYHLTARGGQFQHGKLTKDHSQKSEEWQELMYNSTKEFFRKWGSVVNHNQYMMPIISPKYDIGFVVKNCNIHSLRLLEPWCSNIYTDADREQYIAEEQQNSGFDISERVKLYNDEKNNNIIVEFDSNDMTNERFAFLQELPLIIQDSGQAGHMEYDCFKFFISEIVDYKDTLIVNENNNSNN